MDEKKLRGLKASLMGGIDTVPLHSKQEKPRAPPEGKGERESKRVKKIVGKCTIQSVHNTWKQS